MYTQFLMHIFSNCDFTVMYTSLALSLIHSTYKWIAAKEVPLDIKLLSDRKYFHFNTSNILSNKVAIVIFYITNETLFPFVSRQATFRSASI
jgi:hypothetical protein